MALLENYLNVFLETIITKLKNLQNVYSNDAMPQEHIAEKSEGIEGDLQNTSLSHGVLLTQISYYDELAHRRTQEIVDFTREHYYQYAYEAAQLDIKRRYELKSAVQRSLIKFGAGTSV
jgi:hypothetical protein